MKEKSCIRNVQNHMYITAGIGIFFILSLAVFTFMSYFHYGRFYYYSNLEQAIAKDFWHAMIWIGLIIMLSLGVFLDVIIRKIRQRAEE